MSQKRFLKSALLLVTFVLSSLFSFGQLAEQTGMAFNGQYDIKMVAAPVLQPVWVSAQSPLQVHSVLTDAQMLQCGKYLSLNNETSGTSNSVFLTGSMSAKTAPYVPSGAVGIAMIYADCDDDMSTFQSSAAYLDFGNEMACTTVEAAYLYWMGNNESSTTTYAAYPGLPTLKSHAGGATGNVTGYNTIKFKAPGDAAYTNVTATRTLTTTGQYVCMANVTSLVAGKGGGLYWAANVRNSGYDDGGGAKGGWNLVVIFRPPNCPPRVIKFWDGFKQPAAGLAATLNFAASEVPNTGNSISYLGFCTIDAEDNAGIIADNASVMTLANSGLEFYSANSGATVTNTGYINPFITDQPPVSAYTQDGLLVTGITEGMPSSRITSYDRTTGLNGNEIVRIPSHVNTLGFGAHHMRLPSGFMVPGTRQVKLTFPSEKNGDFGAYLAYMAIETLQPRLVMSKTASVSTAALDDEITYTLKVVNKGGLISRQNNLNYVIDTLDLPVDFVAGSIVYKNKTGAVISNSPGGLAPVISNAGTDANENIKFYLPAINPANATFVPQDSIYITFKAKVKPLTRMDIWNSGCRRTIQNKANLHYDTAEALEFDTESNAEFGCGGGDAFANVYVDDVNLDNYLNQTHIFYRDLSPVIGSNPNIVDIVRQDLVDSTAANAPYNLTLAQANTYAITDLDGNAITGTQKFNTSLLEQTYLATKDVSTDGYECLETFYMTYRIAKVPDMVLTKVDPNCPTTASGSITATMTNGGSGFGVKIVNAAAPNTVLFSSRTKKPTANDVYTAGYLPAGKYYAFVEVYGEVMKKDSITLVDPAPYTVTVAGPATGCPGDVNNYTITPSVAGTYSYAWKSSTDGGTTWTALASTATPLSYSLTGDVILRGYACNGTCSVYDDHSITMNATVGITPMALPAAVCSGTALALPAVNLTGAVATVTSQGWQLGGAAYTAGTNVVYADSAKWLVYVVNTTCGVVRDSVGKIIVNRPPTVAAITSPTGVCAGSNLSLTAPAITINGSAISSQGWELETAVASGTYAAFASPYTVAFADNSKRIRYTATNSCGTTVSNAVAITVNDDPTIAAIASPVAVCAGSDLALTAPAVTTNGAAISFQSWELETAVASGLYATFASPYTVAFADNGKRIRYTATNICGTVVSNAVTITVNDDPILAAIVSPAAVCAGSNLALTAPAITTNGAAISSQGWELETAVASGTYAAFASPYTVAYADNGKRIRYTATNTCGTVVSNAVTITVNDDPILAAIASPLAVCAGSDLTLTAPAITTNGSVISSQGWELETAVASGTYAAFASPYTVAFADNGKRIRYSATNTCGTTVSNAVAITVNDDPILAAIASPVAVCAGSNLSLTVPAITTNGSAISSQGWELETAVASGTYAAFASPYTVAFADNGKRIRYTATNTCGTVLSNAVVITVNDDPILAAIASPATVCAGSNLTLTAPAITTNGAAISTQGWELETAVASGTYVAFASPYTVAFADNGKNIRYTATNACGTVVSNAVTITVNDDPILAAIASPAAVCAGSDLTLTAPAITTNGSVISSQGWELETAVASGTYAAFASPYTVAFVDNGKRIRYTATNACGTVVSNAVAITVNDDPIIAAIISPAAVCNNTNLTLTAPAITTNGSAISTQGWELETAVASGTYAAFTSPYTVVFADNGKRIRYTATNTCGTSVSNAVAITVNPIPAAPTVANYISCPKAVSASKTWAGLVTYSGTLKWYADNNPVTLAMGAAPANYDEAVSINQSYWVSETLAGCESQRAQVTVNITSTPADPTVSNYALCATAGAPISWASRVTSPGTITWYADGVTATSMAAPANFDPATALSAVYHLTVTDGAGCISNRVPVSVDVYALPVLSISNPAAACSPASVDITAAAVTAGSTNVAGLQYYSDAGLTSLVASPAALTTSGTYYIKATSANTCVASAPVAVTVNPAAGIALTTGNDTQAHCISAATITDIKYTLSGGATGASVTGLPTGLSGSMTSATEFTITGTATQTGTFPYTVTTTGHAAPCGAVTATGTITINVLPTLAISNPAAVCSPASVDITAAAVTAGSTNVAGLQYYSDAALTSLVASPAAITTTGNYYIKATSAASCVASAPVVVTVNTAAGIALTSANNTQSLCSTAGGATIANINYTLSGGATDASVAGLPTGLTYSTFGTTFTISGTATQTGTFPYTVTTTGETAPCTAATATGTIEIYTAITGTLDKADASVPNAADGSITILSASGGKPAGSYEFRLSGTKTNGGAAVNQVYNASLTGLEAGTYTIYARNVGESCEYTIGVITVNEPGAISGTATKVDVLCNGASTGSITAEVTLGGTPNYDFQLEKWNGSAFVVHTAYSTANLPAASPFTFNALPAGNYQVRVKDAAAYESIIASVTITEKALVTASGALANPLCITGTGDVTLTLNGGTAPYSYNLNAAGMTAVPVGNVVPAIPLGAYTITAQDANGCPATLGAGMSGTVAATDAIKPTFPTCQGAVSRNTTASLCAYTVVGTELDPVAADNCAVKSLTHNYSGAALNTTLAGETLTNGTSVLWTAVDALGNSHTCTVSLTVVDTQAPTYTTCLANQTRNNTAGQCGYLVVGAELDPVAADNCAVTSLTHNVVGAPSTTTLAGATLPKGTTTITWTAKDAANNSTPCSYTVTVSDTELPVLTCTQTNIAGGFDANQCTWTAAWTAPTATDNCSGVVVERTDATGINIGSAVAAGTYTISYRAKDLAGNVSPDCSFTITVSDTQLPTINCTQNNFTADVNAGACTWTAAWTVPTASDNCPGAIVERTDVTGINIGDALTPGTYTISYRARDAVNNLSASTCSFTITVRDAQNPVITCAANATVSASAGSCTYTVSGNLHDATATDNCLVTSLTHNFATAPSNTTLAGAVINASATVIWTARDAAGNSSTCTTVITVNDTELPTVVLPIANQPAVSNGNCVFTLPDIRPLVRSISSDNCTPRASLNVTQLPVAGTVIPSGTLSVTVQVTVSDLAGMSITVPVIIDVPTQPASITLDPVAALCKNGSPAALTGSPSGNYIGTTQTPAGVINFTEPLNGTYSGPGVSGAQFNPATLAPGMHTLTYTVSPWGCTKSATVQVEVVALPTVSVSASPVCPGQPMVFTASTSVPTTNAWTVNGVLDGAVTANAYTFTNTISGAFVTADVVATESHGCSSSASKTVQVFTQPAAPIANNLVSCKMQALPVQWVTRVSGTAGGALQWYDSPSSPTTVSPVAIDKSVVGVTSYYAAVKGTNGCLSQRTQVSATINPLPVITEVNVDDIKNVQVSVSGAATPFTYTLREQSAQFFGTVNLGLLPFGKQSIVVVDTNLCSVDSTFEIDPVPLIPDKYFSPNGDGVNETWKVKNIEFYPRTEISIHDRFGKELVETKGVDFEQGWDGTYLDKLLPSTDYWYVIEIRETGKRIVGHFLLHR